SDDVTNTGMGPAAFPRRGSHTFGSHSPEMGTGTQAHRTSSYYDDDSYNAGGARGPRSASAMDDPYNPGGRAGDPSYGPRRSSMASASSTRSFDDSQHLGEGASGRGSRGYQTGMGRNISGERTSSYSTRATIRSTLVKGRPAEGRAGIRREWEGILVGRGRARIVRGRGLVRSQGLGGGKGRRRGWRHGFRREVDDEERLGVRDRLDLKAGRLLKDRGMDDILRV
ncbi:hypothetical protein V495_02543, partial [Pseudogymnoascus sp. VKM F-4514 (FW-929)]